MAKLSQTSIQRRQSRTHAGKITATVIIHIILFLEHSAAGVEGQPTRKVHTEIRASMCSAALDDQIHISL